MRVHQVVAKSKTIDQTYGLRCFNPTKIWCCKGFNCLGHDQNFGSQYVCPKI